MSGFSEIIGRPDVAAAMMPDDVSAEIIQGAPADSIVLSRAKPVTMTSKTAKQSVIAELPDAYWLDGDTGLKQTSKASWSGLNMTAEELAVIVPIPDAVIDDSNVPLWGHIRPLLKEAVGKAIDLAALFGVNKPASWPAGIIPAAIAAGNTSTVSAANPLQDAFLSIAQRVSSNGFGINGFASRPGLSWTLRGIKNTQGNYLFGEPSNGSTPTLYGLPLDESRNGAWNPLIAEGLAVDWSKFVVGIRQDVTYDLFKEGVISDADGKVVLNLMQQDTKALRVVMRVGFAHAIPTTRISGNGFPAGVILPAGA